MPQINMIYKPFITPKLVILFLIISGTFSFILPVNATAERLGFFKQNIDQAEEQLKTAFPEIDFIFAEGVHNWYKWLFKEAIITLSHKHLSALQSIVVSKTEMDRRGTVALNLNLTTGGTDLKLRLNSAKFPLETGFSCVTVQQCMRVTNPVVNREFVAVAVHELGHVVDLSSHAFISKGGSFSLFNDTSLTADFYRICFSDAEVLNDHCDRDDFVSHYSKTKAFEHFAETIVAYVLDGNNFYSQAQAAQERQRPQLMRQYLFLHDRIFDQKTFHLKDNAKQRNSFNTRDATKRPYPLGQFLYQY